MVSTVLTELIAERGVLLVDGATGTQLMAAGLEAGDAPERLNLDRPEVVHGPKRPLRARSVGRAPGGRF